MYHSDFKVVQYSFAIELIEHLLRFFAHIQLVMSPSNRTTSWSMREIVSLIAEEKLSLVLLADTFLLYSILQSQNLLIAHKFLPIFNLQRDRYPQDLDLNNI